MHSLKDNKGQTLYIDRVPCLLSNVMIVFVRFKWLAKNDISKIVWLMWC